MTQIPKISFMTTLDVNVGDEFIREGICSFIDEIFSQWYPYYVNKHDIVTLHTKVADEQGMLADKFRDSDLIIQAGAPVYWKIGESTSYNVEWAQSLWYERIFKLGPGKPIMNIAAGACQPFPDNASTYLDDPICVDFALCAADACRWTSVRDPLASQILMTLGIKHEALPCAAFHAARRMKSGIESRKVLGINLMPIGGHFKLRNDVNGGNWRNEADYFVTNARKFHKLLFIAHDVHEKNFMEQFLVGDEQIFISSDYRDYMRAYASCSLVVANRVHGAVCAAGFGRPSIIVGNDTRIMIGDFIGLTNRYVADVTGKELVDLLADMHSRRNEEQDRLLTLRETSAKRYVDAIREAVEPAYADWPVLSPLPITVGQNFLSAEQASFGRVINAFANRNGFPGVLDEMCIRGHCIWSEVLSRLVRWKAPILFVCDEPEGLLPWFIASMGADVTIACAFDMSDQFQKVSLRIGISLRIVALNGSKLPFEKQSFQAVIVNDEKCQSDVSTDELGRVAKFGGWIVTSRFDFEAGNGLCRNTTPRFDGVPLFLLSRLLTLPEQARVLLPRFDTFGDIVLLEGFLELLRHRFPTVELHMLVRSGYEQLAELIPARLSLRWITVEQEAYKQTSPEKRGEFKRFAGDLAGQKWDLVLFTALNKTWLDHDLCECFASVPQVNIGMHRDLGGMEPGISTIAVEEKSREQDKYLIASKLLFGASSVLSEPVLHIPSDVEKRVATILLDSKLSPNAYVVCVPGGTHNQRIKAWPLEHYAELLDWMVKSYGLQVLLLGHEEETALILSLEGMLRSREVTPVVWLGKDGELPLLAGLLGSARMYVGNDTGPLHIAVALGIPVVGVFGGGTYPRFLPSGPRSVSVVAELPCFGCYWECIFGIAFCLKLVPVTAVQEGTERILSDQHFVENVIRVQLLDDDGIITEIVGHAARMATSKKKECLSLLENVNREYLGEIASLREQIIFLQSSIDDLRRSASWRITAPLRRVAESLRIWE